MAGCASPATTTPPAELVDSTTTSTSTLAPEPVPSSTTTSTTLPGFSTGDVEGFISRDITLDGEEWTVEVADTPDLRQRGLMFVRDLGDLQGMVFVFEEELSGGFWMKNTLIPLDIAFFDTSGEFVGSLTMEPCQADPCPTYEVGRMYRYAVEAPAGNLSHLDTTSILEF